MSKWECWVADVIAQYHILCYKCGEMLLIRDPLPSVQVIKNLKNAINRGSSCFFFSIRNKNCMSDTLVGAIQYVFGQSENQWIISLQPPPLPKGYRTSHNFFAANCVLFLGTCDRYFVRNVLFMVLNKAFQQ